MQKLLGGKFETVEEIGQDLLDRAAHLLASEFYPPERYEEGRSDYSEQLQSGGTIVRVSLLDGEVAGIATFNIFEWERIAPQLYFQAIFSESELTGLKLRKFEDAIQDIMPLQLPGIAAEMAYNLVMPAYRGNGLGRLQWQARMSRIQSVYQNPLVFTLARSEYSGVRGITQVTKDYMLQQERLAQGLSLDQDLLVKGVIVPIAQMAGDLSLELVQLNMYSGSKPTLHLAQSEGFLPIGFSKNFCPVWVKQFVDEPGEA